MDRYVKHRNPQKHHCSTHTGIIWLDIGECLSNTIASRLSSPVQTGSWQVDYLPVIQHKRNIALKPHSRLLSAAASNTSSQAKIIQSAASLHLDYGRNLDRAISASDSFYALHELFSFASFSEVQFLNMLESKLTKELDQSVMIEQQNPTLSNLLYHQQVLGRHIRWIQDNITKIEDRNLAKWPRMPLDKVKQLKSEIAAEKLLKDYRHLLFHAQTLSDQCNKGMHIVMNNAMIKESREAIAQAAGVAKLTRLAFLFIPLGFTTSFWGMNFKQITGDQDIWWWFVMSFPIFVISMIFMKYEVSGVVKKCDDPTSLSP